MWKQQYDTRNAPIQPLDSSFFKKGVTRNLLLGKVTGDQALTNKSPEETHREKMFTFDDGEIPADTYRPKIIVEEGGARGTNFQANRGKVYGLGSQRA